MAQSVLYGVQQTLDVSPTTLAVEVDRDLLIHNTQITLQQHNAEIAQFGRLFHADTLKRQTRFKTTGGNELQPGDEYTDPVPVKGGGFFDVAFPLTMFFTAWGQTFVTAQKMTVEDLSDNVNLMLQGDATTYRKMIMAALLKKESYQFTDDDGTLTIAGLANGDGTLYLDQGADGPTTADHYSAQAAAIDDANNPFPMLEAKLKARPRNAGPYVQMIPTNLKTSVTNLDSFVSSGSSIVQAPAGTTSSLILPNGIVLPPSATVIGGIDGTETVIAEWPRLPNNYILGGALGGPPPLLRRQHAEAPLQGFNPVADESDKFPFSKQRWFRAMGFGGWNRTGWTAHLVGAANYATPAAFNNPLGK